MNSKLGSLNVTDNLISKVAGLTVDLVCLIKQLYLNHNGFNEFFHLGKS